MGTYNVGGLIGYNDASAEPNTIIKNVELSEHTLIADNTVGGLVGYQKNGGLSGYNIRIYKQTSPMHNNNNGYILGNNVNGQTIKIVGFSRQEGINRDRMVGNKIATASDRYGSGGYVIFADYNDTASDELNAKFSNLGKRNNVGILEYDRSDSLSVDYEVVKNGFSTEVSPSFQTVPYFPSADVEENESISYSGTKVEYVEDTSETAQTAADITSTRGQSGFKLYCVGASKYVTSTTKDPTGTNTLLNEGDENEVAVWYFVPVENSTDTFVVYTLKNNVPYYIKRNNQAFNSNLDLTTTANQATKFLINKETPAGVVLSNFTLKVVGETITDTNRNSCLNHSNNSGNPGIRFYSYDGPIRNTDCIM